jgi:hypothetical protein
MVQERGLVSVAEMVDIVMTPARAEAADAAYE